MPRSPPDKLTFSLVNRQWSISVNLNNALDKKYFAGIANFTSQGLYYTWGAPRSLNVGARYDF